MIQFSDVSRKVESLVAPSFLQKYDSIKPETDINEKDAHEFWDSVFSKPNDIHQITEAEIVKEVYGRSEEEFDFEFDITSNEIQDVINKFRNPEWESLSVEEKEAICKELVQCIAEGIGIENPPSMELYEADPCDCGSFDPDRNCIKVNINNFDDPQEVINTVAHETRHAYQYQKAVNPESYIDILYAYNFTHYITPYVDENGCVNFIDYQDQLIEAEARAFANLFNFGGGKDE